MLVSIKVVLLDDVVKILSADGCSIGSILLLLPYCSLIVESVAVLMDVSLVVLLRKCLSV
jgi:hypothetical protein